MTAAIQNVIRKLHESSLAAKVLLAIALFEYGGTLLSAGANVVLNAGASELALEAGVAVGLAAAALGEATASVW